MGLVVDRPGRSMASARPPPVGHPQGYRTDPSIQETGKTKAKQNTFLSPALIVFPLTFVGLSRPFFPRQITTDRP
jgi:hypothetical protein